MSWYGATGATTPRLSWMFGPVGAAGSWRRGSAIGVDEAHSSDAPSPIHAQGAPNTALSCAGVIAFAWPVAVSPIHSSTPLSRMCVKAKRLPSAEKPIQVERPATAAA